MSRPSIFVSYSHKDRQWKDRIVTHLEVLNNKVDVWEDSQLRAGDDWYEKLDVAIASASVSLLLVSANSLTSRFILREEVTRLLQRRLEGGMTVIPVIVKDCAWKEIGWLAALQVRPLDGVPLQRLRSAEREEALKHLAVEVVRIASSAPERGQPDGVDLPQLDWEEERDIDHFVGRSSELQTLHDLIPRTRLLAIVGRGGMGKSLLVQKAARELTTSFDRVIWRTLKDGKSLAELLASCLRALTSDKPGLRQLDASQRTRLFLDELKKRRCLVILDNAESIMHEGGPAGTYRKGYEEYEAFFRAVGGSPHRSCIVVTSRELPEEFRAMDGDGPVRIFHLRGLDAQAAKELLIKKGVSVTDEEVADLADKYGGSPQDIKLVAEPILTVFGGSVSTFLAEGAHFVGETERCLSWHFDRTSPLETSVLYWLALTYDPTPWSVLLRHMESCGAVSRGEFQTAIQSLNRRSLIESVSGSFALQGVVLEYAQRRFVEAVAADIEAGKAAVLRTHPLLLAGSRDAIRRSQERQIIGAILNVVRELDDEELGSKVRMLLGNARTAPRPNVGHTAGSLLNLLRGRGVSLDGIDLSGLAVWQAYLQGAELRRGNLDRCDLSGSVFTDTFSDISAVTCSPDGRLVATGSTNGEVRVWRLSDMALIHRFAAHNNEVWTVTFSPDGRILASGGEDETIHLWDTTSFEPVTQLTETGGAIFALAFHPCGAWLAYAGNNGTLAVHDMQGNRARPPVPSEGRLGGTYALAWAPDGGSMATGGDDHLVRLWTFSEQDGLVEARALDGHTNWVRAVAFSPDGARVVSGSYDCTIRVWDRASGQATELRGHTGWVRSIAFSPAGRLASCGNDGTARLWDVASGRCERVLEGHSGTVWSVAWTPDGRTVVSGGNDQTIRFWDATIGEESIVLKGFVNSVRGIAFHPDGKRLAAGGSDHRIRIWDIASGGSRTLSGHTDWVRSLVFSPGGEWLFSASNDSTVRVWATESGVCDRVFTGHQNWIYRVATTGDGLSLVTSSTDRTVRIWDASAGLKRIFAKGVPDVAGYSVAVSRDGRLIAIGGVDLAVRVWDVGAGSCRHVLRGHTRQVGHLSFDATGSRLLTSGDRRVLLWDMHDGALLRVFDGHGDWVRSAELSDDARLAISGDDDGEVRLWSVESGACTWTTRQHGGIVWIVALHPEAGLAASGSNDETIRVWSVATGQCVKVLRNDRPYEGTSIRGVTGITDAQKRSLKALGAVE